MIILDCSSYGIGTGTKPARRSRPFDDHGHFVPKIPQAEWTRRLLPETQSV